MKRMTQIFFLGLILSVSSVAMAGQDRHRNGHDVYYGDQRHNAHQYERHHDRRHGRRHYVRSERHARRHSHHGRYCHDWHPRGYVAPHVRYGYDRPGLVIVYGPRTGLYIGGGR